MLLIFTRQIGSEPLGNEASNVTPIVIILEAGAESGTSRTYQLCATASEIFGGTGCYLSTRLYFVQLHPQLVGDGL